MAKVSEMDCLRLFISKVERLHSLSLVRSFEENGSKLTIKKDSGDPAIRLAVVGPDSEQIDAFVLTLRMFVQDNEPISLRRMADLYDGLQISAQLKGNFARHRAFLNEFLEFRGPVALDGVQPTRRDIMLTFLYGDLSHTNQNYRERYTLWMSNPVAGQLLKFEFDGVLLQMLRTLRSLANNARCAIREINGETGRDWSQESG